MRIRDMMKKRGLKKEVSGCSMIEIEGVVHEFSVREYSAIVSTEIKVANKNNLMQCYLFNRLFVSLFTKWVFFCHGLLSLGKNSLQIDGRMLNQLLNFTRLFDYQTAVARKHKTHRLLGSNEFSTKILNFCIGAFNENAVKLVSRVSTAAAAKQIIDLHMTSVSQVELAMIGNFISKQLPYSSWSFVRAHCTLCGIDKKITAANCNVSRVKPAEQTKLFFVVDSRKRFVPPLPEEQCSNTCDIDLDLASHN
ncbi:hypothetical protein ACFE04_007014 [Oxalis oulophora]